LSIPIYLQYSKYAALPLLTTGKEKRKNSTFSADGTNSGTPIELLANFIVKIKYKLQ